MDNPRDTPLEQSEDFARVTIGLDAQPKVTNHTTPIIVLSYIVVNIYIYRYEYTYIYMYIYLLIIGPTRD